VKTPNGVRYAEVSPACVRSGAGEPTVSLDARGISLDTVLCPAGRMAARTPKSPEAVHPEPFPLLGPPLRLSDRQRESCRLDVCCPSPEPGTHGGTAPVQRLLCLGRYEGTETFRGRRDHPASSLHSSSPRRANLHKCLVQPRWCTSRRKCRQNTLPGMDYARPAVRRKKIGKNPLLGRVCLLTTGDLISVRRGVGSGACCLPVSHRLTSGL